MPEKMRKVPQLSFYFVISLLRSGILISEKQHYDVSDEITGNFLLCATTSIGTKNIVKVSNIRPSLCWEWNFKHYKYGFSIVKIIKQSVDGHETKQ